MKKSILILTMIFCFLICNAQKKYDKVFDYGVYKSNWALVQKGKYFGFIDDDGRERVKPKYDTIYKFGIYATNKALIQKRNCYGLIDDDGRVRVKPKYDSIYKFGTIDPNYTIIEKNKKQGLINCDGLVYYKPKYDQIIKEDNTYFGVKKGKKTVLRIKSKTFKAKAM